MATAREKRFMRKGRSGILNAEKALEIPLGKWLGTDEAPYGYDADWEVVKATGISIVKPEISNIFGGGGKLSFEIAGNVPFPFDPLKKSSAGVVDKLCSKLVTDVTDETRKAINIVVKDGIKKGLNSKEIGRMIRPKVGLNTQMLKWSAAKEEELIAQGLSERQVYQRLGAYERKLHRMRNETIARTEAANAWTEGSRTGYKESGVKKLKFFALFDHCPICDEYEGQIYSWEDSAGVITIHPR